MWLDLVTWTRTVVLADALLQGDGLASGGAAGCVAGLCPHRGANNPRGRFLGG